MRRLIRLLALTVALLLLHGLILLTAYAASYSHAGVVRLFASGLFVSLALLLFSPHRVELPAQTRAAQTSHSA